LGYIPGLIHAWYIIVKYPEQDPDEASYEPIPGGASQRRDLENGNVTYYYVSHQPVQHPAPRSYGTVANGQQASAQSNSTNKSQSHGQHEGTEQGGSGSAPPTYAEAVKGDNKVQSDE
jgi:hypothetical protein